MYELEEPTTSFEFANQTTTLPAHTIKLSVQIRNWPFYSMRNVLHLEMDSSESGESTTSQLSCVASKKDDKDNVKWVMLVVNNHYLYLFILYCFFRRSFFRFFFLFPSFSLLILFDRKRYAQFLDKAVVDGRPQNISFRLSDDKTGVSAILPHFWSYVGM